MATMPILLETSANALTLLSGAATQPTQSMQSGDTPLFQEFMQPARVDVKAAVETSPVATKVEEEVFQADMLDGQNGMPRLHASLEGEPTQEIKEENDLLDVLFALCIPQTETVLEASDTHQDSSKESRFVRFESRETVVLANAEAWSQVGMTVQKIEPKSQNALQLETLEVLKTPELQMLQEQKSPDTQLALVASEVREELLTQASAPFVTQSVSQDLELGSRVRELGSVDPQPELASLLSSPEHATGVSQPGLDVSEVQGRIMVNQLSEAIPYQTLKLEGQHQFKLQLHPKALGEVNVHLTLMDQGEVQAVFSGLPGTMDLLQQHSNLLCEALKREGFEALSENFSFTSDQSSQRDFERAERTLPVPTGEVVQLGAPQPASLEASIRRLLQQQGSGLNISLRI